MKGWKNQSNKSMSYIPASDANFNNWLTNFSAVLSADPSAYGESSGSAAGMASLTAAWSLAYAAATNPETRTSPAVAAKDAARFNATQEAQQIAARIRANTSVSNAQRVDIGLPVPSATPTPVPAPTSAPALALRSATPGVQLLAYSDTAAPTGKAKPYGVIGVEMWVSTGTVPATDPAACKYVGTFTKSPFRLAFGAGDAGKVMTAYARFVTRSGPAGVAQTGPWSAQLVSVII